MEDIRKRKGRSSKDNDSKVFGILLTSKEHEELKRQAKAERMTMSDYVRHLIFADTSKETEIRAGVLKDMFTNKGLQIIKEMILLQQ